MNGVLLSGGAAGVALGLVFYGGLWFTVNRLGSSRHPFLLALASYWMRTILVAAGAVYFAQRYWPSAVALLAGFVAGRVAIKMWLRERRPIAPCT